VVAAKWILMARWSESGGRGFVAGMSTVGVVRDFDAFLRAEVLKRGAEGAFNGWRRVELNGGCFNLG
jgi:hypothetical protein